MPRLLILSAGAGAGHNRAAEAIHASCESSFTTVPSEWIDSLDCTSRLFRALYGDSYVLMASYSPALWGLLYKMMGKKADRKRLERLVKAYDRMANRRLLERVRRFRPDAVICTHFLPANVMATRAREIPLYIVVTDFDVHSLWVNRRAAGYFVGNEEVAWQLRHYGYPAERVRVTGIPIHPSFMARRGEGRARRELRLPHGRPIVVFMSGGFGMGDMAGPVDRMLSLHKNFHLVVICGRNEQVRRKLAERARKVPDRLTVRGFVGNVPDYLEAADLVITKAGGLSVSECLARGVPMVILSPIPGQEERNCDFLLERGAAVKAKGPELLDYKVQELLAAPERLAKMRSAALAVARPEAGREVVSHVLQDLAVQRFA